MENASNLLFDSLLHYVRYSNNQVGKYKLLNKIIVNGQDPTEKLRALVDSSKMFNNIWTLYENDERLKDYTFPQANDLHNHLVSLASPIHINLFLNKPIPFGALL